MMDEMQKNRGYQYCPTCGQKIFINQNYNYSCPVHGDFKLHSTGRLEHLKK